MSLSQSIRSTCPGALVALLCLVIGIAINVIVAWWCAAYSDSPDAVDVLSPWRDDLWRGFDQDAWYWSFTPEKWRASALARDAHSFGALRASGRGVDRWRVVRLKVSPETGGIEQYAGSRFAVFAGLPFRSMRAETDPLPFPSTTGGHWNGGFDLPSNLGGAWITLIVTGVGPPQQPGIPLIPMWRGTLANTALYGLATYVVFWCLRLARWHRRRARGRCGRCGYPADAATCPECGLTTPEGSG